MAMSRTIIELAHNHAVSPHGDGSLPVIELLCKKQGKPPPPAPPGTSHGLDFTGLHDYFGFHGLLFTLTLKCRASRIGMPPPPKHTHPCHRSPPL